MYDLIIARHGNTFEPGEKILRVGLRTDLNLASSGVQQAIALGNWIKENSITLSSPVFVSNLKRTQQTAAHALQAALVNLEIIQHNALNEIDYGAHDGLDENEIQKNHAAEYHNWELNGVFPSTWLSDRDTMIANWDKLLTELSKSEISSTKLIITSNGTARLCGYATLDKSIYPKLKTGHLGILKKVDGNYKMVAWNVNPAIRA